MSWYSEETDSETKEFLEWAFNCELEPDEEPGFYRDKYGDRYAKQSEIKKRPD